MLERPGPARGVVSSLRPMPSTKRRSAAQSCALLRLGTLEASKAQRLALQLGTRSGKLLAFLLSTLKPRARYEYTRALQAFSSNVPPRWRRWSFEKRDEWLALYVLEAVEETSTPGPMRVLGAGTWAAWWPKTARSGSVASYFQCIRGNYSLLIPSLLSS